MGLWTEPLARLAALVEGTYAPAPVGRAVTPGRFTATRLHGDIEDPSFPVAHFHRGYRLILERTGYADPDTAQNPRAGQVRKRGIVLLSIGYRYGTRAPGPQTAALTATSADAHDGHDDHELIEAALIYQGNRGGTSPEIYVIRRVEDAVARVIVSHERLLVETRYAVEIAYQPGQVWP